MLKYLVLLMTFKTFFFSFLLLSLLSLFSVFLAALQGSDFPKLQDIFFLHLVNAHETRMQEIIEVVLLVRSAE